MLEDMEEAARTGQTPELMNAQALATHLGVTERTVRRWIEREELPAQKRGRSFVIRREDGERMRLRRLGGRLADDRDHLEKVVVERGNDLAQLQGRYMELQERVARLERELDAERRRSIGLEIDLARLGEVPSSRAA